MGGGVFLTHKQVLGPGPRMGPHSPDLRGPVDAPAGVPGRRQLRDPTQIVCISPPFVMNISFQKASDLFKTSTDIFEPIVLDITLYFTIIICSIIMTLGYFLPPLD